MEWLTGVKCEAIGSDIVKVRGNLFQYRRQGDITTLDLNEELTIEEVYTIKEVIQLYEELIALN